MSTDNLPLTYAALPTAKLEEEQNPFEQSFETAAIVEPPRITKRPSKYNVDDGLFINHSFTNATRSNNNDKSNIDQEEEKRKSFLERNRIAALKCRQRKKQWLENLQLKVDYLTTNNEQYRIEVNTLKRELVELRAMLVQHENCPINQQALIAALKKPIPQ